MLASRVCALALALGILAGAAGCQTSDFNITSNGTTSDGFALLPQSLVLVVSEAKTYNSVGGVPPYTFAIKANNSGGTIDANGNYVAGTTPNVTDTLEITDSFGKKATATVQVKPVLVVTSPTTPVMTGDTQTITATGGVPPYSFSVSQNLSTGSIDSTSGLYTAGNVGVVTDKVTVQDSASTPHTASASIVVNPAIALSPTSLTAGAANTSKVFNVTGGISPYTITIASAGGASGKINGGVAPVIGASATYTAGAAGTDTVTVTDSKGHVVHSAVTVNASLAVVSNAPPGTPVLPLSVYTLPATGTVLTASGGVPPYTYAFNGASGASPVSTIAGTTYTTGDNITAGVVFDNIKVTDSDTPPASQIVSVNIDNRPNITAITPNSGTVFGGTLITISGNNFASVTSVAVGGVTGTIAVTGAGSVTLTTGTYTTTNANSTVNVVVNAGAKQANSAGGYTYLAPALQDSLLTSGDIYSSASTDPFLGALDAGNTSLNGGTGNNCSNNAGYAINPAVGSTSVLTLEPSGNLWTASTDGKAGTSPAGAQCTAIAQGFKAIASTPVPSNSLLYGLTQANKLVQLNSSTCAVGVLDGQGGNATCPFALTLACNVTNGSTAVSGCIPPLTGSFIASTPVGGIGIAAGTTVSAVGSSSAFTLSTAIGPPQLSCTETLGSKVIACPALVAAGVAVGSTVTGTGIPGGTTVTAVDFPSGNVTLSQAAGAPAGAQTLTFGTLNLTFTGATNTVASDCSLTSPRFRSLSFGTSASAPGLKLYLLDFAGQVFDAANLSGPVSTLNPKQRSAVFY